MKKIIALCLTLCLAFSLVACGGNETPSESQPQDTTPAPQVKEYVLVKAKAEIAKDIQITPESIEQLFEAYTTTDAAEAASAIRWDNRKTAIQHLWTKDVIPAGTLVNPSMFTITVPNGVLPPTDEEIDKNLTYDGAYTAVVHQKGMYIDVAAEDLLNALPASVRNAHSIPVTFLTVHVKDKNEENRNVYNDAVKGKFDLAKDNGMLRFELDVSAVDLSGLEMLGKPEELIPLMIYSGYTQKGFSEPLVKLSTSVLIDGKEYKIALGGTFTMAVDPSLDLSGNGMEDLLEGIFGNGQGIGGLFGDLFSGGLEELFGQMTGGKKPE